MKLSNEEYVGKRIHNGCLVQIESPVTQDNCSACPDMGATLCMGHEHAISVK